MAYDKSSGLITAPVSIRDLQRCLRTIVTVSGRRYISGDLGYIIANGGINKWAKYKPVPHASVNTVTGQWDAARNKWLSTASWWKSPNGQCGLKIPYGDNINNTTNPNSVLYKLLNGLMPWTYIRPSGGAASPYRLQDFAGYFREAVPAVGECGVPDGGIIWVERQGTGTQMQIDWDAPSVGDENLSLADISIGGVSLQEFYLGVFMYRDDNHWFVVTSTTPIGSTSSLSITTQIGYDDIGKWYLIPFLSSRRLTRDGERPSGTYLGCDINTPIVVNIKSSGQVIQIFTTASWIKNNTQVWIQPFVKNNLTSQQTLSGVNVYIYTTNSPSDNPDESGQFVMQVPFGSCTIQADDTFIYDPVTVSLTRDQSLTYWATARPRDSSVVFENDWYQLDEDQPMPE